MSKQTDTSKYRSLLCRVAAKAHRIDFPELFKQVLIRASIPEHLHFLLKMELKRLQKPCMRLIDLRGSVDGDCQPFVFEQRTHYLDDVAKAVFNDQYNNFKDFTVGVYECVMNTPNNYRVMHEKEKQAGIKAVKPVEPKNVINYKVPSLAFNNFHSRKEERMHFVADASLVSGDELTWLGKTVDLSVSGCQIKTAKKYSFREGQVIQIRFKKFEEEYVLGLSKGLDYKVVAIDKTDPDFNILRLSRRRCDLTIRFDEFIENFIKGNKRRYKINLDNSIQSVMNRGYAQYSMPRRTDLNIFLRKDMLELEPFMAVVTEMNKDIVEYWQDSARKLYVGHALTSDRLALLQAKLERGVSDSYLYTFSGVSINNEKVFYAAFKEELDADPELKKLFLTLGNKQYDFRVFSVTMSESSEEYAYQPFSLVTDNIQVFKKLNKRPSPRLMHRLKGLSHILSIKDISTDFNRQDYVTSEADNTYLKKVRRLKVERIKNRTLQIAPIKFIDLRREERYEYTTPVLIKTEKHSLAGQSVDLSTKGMKVRFESPVDLHPKADVLIDFPEFDKEHEGIKLNKLRYRVVSISPAKTEVCLVISGEAREHRGRIYIRDLINRNKNFLLNYQTGLQDMELSWCVQNILSSSSTTFTTYIKKRGRRFEPVIATPGSFKSKFLNRISNGFAIDLAFLFNSVLYKKFIETGLGQRHLNHASNKHDIFIAMKGNKFDIKLDIEFKNSAEKAYFVKKARDNGEFYCLSGNIAKTGRPDLSRVSAELNYISMYAMHKGKEIEEALWSVCGVMEFKEITGEVVSRLTDQLQNLQTARAA